MNLGEKINKFDKMNDNTVKAFEKLFKVPLNSPMDKEVEILGVETGGLRRLIIGELEQLVDMRDSEDYYFSDKGLVKKGKTGYNKRVDGRRSNGKKPKHIYYAEKDGKVLTFYTRQSIAEFFDRTPVAISKRFTLTKNKPLDGWTITREER